MNNHFYVRKEEKWERNLSKVERLDGPAEVKKYSDAVILPLRYIDGSDEQLADWLLEGGVCDADGKFVAGQARRYQRKKDGNRSCVRGYAYDKAKIKHRDETVIWGGILAEHWGHMLIDTASRLWYPLQDKEPFTRIVFSIIPGAEFKYAALLAQAGITEDRYEIIKEPTSFTEVIVPEETIHSLSAVYKDEWFTFYDKLRASVEPECYDKLYLTRTALNTGKGVGDVIGEEYFEEYFRNKGFKVVSTEQLDIKEQIALIAGAKEIACTSGTLMHMAAFAQDGTKLYVMNRSDGVTKVQFIINKMRNLETYFIDCKMSFLPERPVLSTWFVAPTEPWNRFVKDIFGEEPDVDYKENVFPKVCLEYIRTWGLAIRSEKKFKVVRNANIKSLAENLNEVIHEELIDFSSYEDADELVALRKENEKLKAELVSIKKSSVGRLAVKLSKK